MLGKKTEDLGSRAVKLYPEMVDLGPRKLPNGQNYDKFLSAGESGALLEIKYRLSPPSSDPRSGFMRTVGQVSGMSSGSRGGRATAGIWFLREPTRRNLNALRDAVGSTAWRNVKRYHGVDGLIRFLERANMGGI